MASLSFHRAGRKGLHNRDQGVTFLKVASPVSPNEDALPLQASLKYGAPVGRLYKTLGFNPESTDMTDPDKPSTFIAILAKPFFKEIPIDSGHRRAFTPRP